MKKKELGKGIRALLSNIEEEQDVKREELVKELSKSVAAIPVEDIEVNPFQPRSEFDEEAMKELANSIRTHGLIQPITVRHVGDGTYQIISGERRLRAARMVGLEEVPAYVRIADDQGMLELALVENIQRKDLNPIEIALTYKRLMDECDLTHEELAERVSKQRSTVTNYMRLLKLPPVIQHSLKQRKMSMGHARALVGISDIATQLSLYEKILSKGLSVREVENYLKAPKSKSKGSSRSDEIRDPNLQRIQDDLCALLGTRVNIRQQKSGKGQIVIHFKDNRELNQLLDMIQEED